MYTDKQKISLSKSEEFLGRVPKEELEELMKEFDNYEVHKKV